MALQLLLLLLLLLVLLDEVVAAGEDVAMIRLLLFALLVSVDIAAAIFRHGGP